jgi:hypothetical protein
LPLCFCFVVLRMEPRALCRLGKSSITELHLQPHCPLEYAWQGLVFIALIPGTHCLSSLICSETLTKGPPCTEQPVRSLKSWSLTPSFVTFTLLGNPIGSTRILGLLTHHFYCQAGYLTCMLLSLNSCDLFLDFFFFFWWNGGLNLGHCGCKAGTLLLEPHFRSVLLWLFWRWDLKNYLSRLALFFLPHSETLAWLLLLPEAIHPGLDQHTVTTPMSLLNCHLLTEVTPPHQPPYLNFQHLPLPRDLCPPYLALLFPIVLTLSNLLNNRLVFTFLCSLDYRLHKRKNICFLVFPVPETVPGT